MKDAAVQVEDSLGRRYIYKVFANGVGFVCGTVIQVIVPRALGPAVYGDFSFLTSFFNQVVGFFDSGTSTGFYTKLSQRRGEPGLTVFYAWFMAAVAATVAAGLVLAHLSGLHRLLWPGQGIPYVYMALLFALSAWAMQVLGQMADAHGLTVAAERGRMAQKIAGIALLGALLLVGRLTLASYFFYNYVVTLVLVGILWAVLRRHSQGLPREWGMSRTQVRGYGEEFYRYASPLFVYGIVVMGEGLFDRWLLQVYGGSIQQGFYGLSYQIGSVCFLFCGAMTALIMREFSVAHGANDLVRMAELFRRHIPLLYSITAYFSCFVAVNAENVTLLIGGGKYREAALPVCIMALFPIHQTYGQLSSSVFYAMEETRLYRNIGVVFSLLSLPVTYLMIAPPDRFGLGAGATGLALKMVLINILSVNVQLYYNAKQLRLVFWKYAAHQFVCVGTLLLLAAVSTRAAEWFFPGRVAAFLGAGVLYTVATAVTVRFYPMLFGMRKDDVALLLRRLRQRTA